MATSNINRPGGLRPERYLSGAPWNGQAQLYVFSASNAVDAYIYDICSIDTTNRSNGGTGNPAWTDAYVQGVPAIQTVASDITTAAQRGVIIGFAPEPLFTNSVSASLGLKYRKASTARYAWVVDDPAVIFHVQENAQSYTSGSNNAINKTAGTAYTAGNTTSGVSKTQLKSSDVQTAAARPMRIYRYVPTVDNFGWQPSDNPSYAKFEVLLANSDLVQAAATNFGA